MGKTLFLKGLTISLLILTSLSCLNKNVNLGERWLVLTEASDEEQQELWLHDFDQLVHRLEKEHPGLLNNLSQEQWTELQDNFRQNLAQMDNLQRYAELLKIVAQIEDGHCQLIPSFSQHLLPLEFQTFKEGIFVVSATEDHSELLGRQLIMIGSSPVDQAFVDMDPYISASNSVEEQFRLTKALSSGELLYLAGLSNDPENVVFTFMDREDHLETLLIQTHQEEENPPWTSLAPRDTDAYSLEFFEDASLLVLHYNQCREDEEYSIDQLVQDLSDYEDQADYLVVDLRSNGGGDSRVFQPIHRYIEDSPFNRRGHLFTAIGRGTYSSAMINAIELQQATRSIYIGENSGGKPNHFGEVKRYVLPNSGLTLQYSTKYFRCQDRETPWLSPQIPLNYSIEDYLEGKDPLVDLIRNQLLEVQQ